MTPRKPQALNLNPRRWLERAAHWRVLSLLFQLPTRESRREVRRLAESVAAPLAKQAEAWARLPLAEAVAEYHGVLGPGRIPATESSYDPNALAGRGPVLSDVAGFYEAFAYRPEKPPAELADHVAMELDFLAWMAFKVAHAAHAVAATSQRHPEHMAQREGADITAKAYESFLKAHLRPWMPAFRQRLENSGSDFYARAARFLPAPVKTNTAAAGVLRVLALLILAALIGATAMIPAAQAQPALPAQASQAASPPPSAGGVTFSGSLRARLENWRWFETPSGEDAYTFGAFNLRLALEQKRERVEWRVEGLFPLLIGLPTGAVLPPPQGQLGLGASYFAASGRQDGSAILRQAYVRFKGLFGDAASSVRLGRFEFADGSEATPADATLAVLKRDRIAQRLIGGFGFSHVGRGFDGVHYARSTPRDNYTLLAARPTEGVFQLRSHKQLGVDFYYAAWTRQLPGKSAQAETRLFALHYHDSRRTLKTDNRPQAVRAADTENIRLTTFGGHALGVFDAAEGKVDLLVWAAGQFGSWGVLDHRAAAVAVEAGYQFDAPGQPWLRGGYFRSTGDADPDDDRHATFFQILPTPRIYARLPFYNLMNFEEGFAEFRLKPHERLVLRADVRHLRLSNRQDLWFLGGGAFQRQTFGYVGRPTNGHKGLGTLFDFSLDYQATAKTALSLYFGAVRGAAVPASIYPVGGKNPLARFFYLEFTQRF